MEVINTSDIADIRVYHITNTLYESQFAINFIIYSFDSDQYRMAYKQFFQYFLYPCLLVTKDKKKQTIT